MAQQTAVEWLEQEYKKWYRKGNPIILKLIKQAKQMDKEQALGLADEAYEAGRLHEEFCNVFDDPKGRFINSITK
jgi:hypothetical protein